MIEHEELVTKAFAAYENSTINYGLSDTEMLKKLQGMNDAVLWGFIGFCEKN